MEAVSRAARLAPGCGDLGPQKGPSTNHSTAHSFCQDPPVTPGMCVWSHARQGPNDRSPPFCLLLKGTTSQQQPYCQGHQQDPPRGGGNGLSISSLTNSQVISSINPDPVCLYSLVIQSMNPSVEQTTSSVYETEESLVLQLSAFQVNGIFVETVILSVCKTESDSHHRPPFEHSRVKGMESTMNPLKLPALNHL